MVTEPFSVALDSDQGVSFSVEHIGGYMEVWNLSDLNWVIDSATYSSGGQVLYSANTIPISFIYGGPPEPVISQLNLASDGISSGRRRLGMLVYVQETQTVYQYTIPNYSSIWNVAQIDGSITELQYGYQVLNDSAGGIALINAWTGSTIEGQSGTTRNDARWRIFYGTDVQITGGTYFSATSILNLSNTRFCFSKR